MNEVTINNEEFVWVKNPLEEIIDPIDATLCIGRCQRYRSCEGFCYIYFTW